MTAYETFKALLRKIEENNQINGADWKDLSDAHSVFEVYGVAHDSRLAQYIDKIIETNNSGDLAYDVLKTLEAEDYGYNFSDDSDRCVAWKARQAEEGA